MISNEFTNEIMSSIDEDDIEGGEEHDDDEEAEEEEDDDDDDEGDDDEDDDEDDDDDDDIVDAQINNSAIIHATPNLPSLSDPSLSSKVREIGHDAIWSLSTAKPGNGVTQIRDQSLDTYWQSDGGQPHLINIHFLKRRSVCEIAFYLDYSQDESYTPKQLSIRTGITFHELEEVKVVELNEPIGWVSVPLYAEPDPFEDDDEDNNMENDSENDENKNRKRKPLRTYLLQVCIVSMHQNGRDLHCRQVKVFGPRSEAEAEMSRTTTDFGSANFKTKEMSQFSVIR